MNKLNEDFGNNFNDIELPKDFEPKYNNKIFEETERDSKPIKIITVEDIVNLTDYHTFVRGLSGKTGKILFDTHQNTRAFVDKYKDREVINMWAAMVPTVSNANSPECSVRKYIICYISSYNSETGESYDD